MVTGGAEDKKGLAATEARGLSGQLGVRLLSFVKTNFSFVMPGSNWLAHGYKPYGQPAECNPAPGFCPGWDLASSKDKVRIGRPVTVCSRRRRRG